MTDTVQGHAVEFLFNYEHKKLIFIMFQFNTFVVSSSKIFYDECNEK